METVGKVIFGIVLFAVCCGCMDALDDLQGQNEVHLEVTLPEASDTKTVASDRGDAYSVTWTGNEKVSVNCQESLSISVDAANPKRAVFTFGVVTPPYTCVYPASACMSMSGTTGVLMLPSEQKYVRGSFDPDAALMIGYSEQNGRIAFHHAVSYLLVKVITSDSVPFASVSVSGNDSERMSGEFVADFRTLAVTSAEKDGTSATVSGDTGYIPSGEVVMIAVPARTYEKGISISLNTIDGLTKTLRSSVRFPAEAGAVYPTTVVLETGSVTIDGLKDLPVVPMDSWFEECVISTSVKKTLSLAYFMDLNQSSGIQNSHSDGHDRSSLKMMYSTFQTMGAEDGYRYPHYARVRVMSDGSYIQMWQTPSDEDVNKGSKNGKDVYYSLSKDFKTWSAPSELFKSKNIYYDIFNRDVRHYSNGNGIVLSNGDFLAVASFRAPEIYHDESYKSYQGIAIRRSADCGKSWSTEQVIYNGPCWEPHLMEVEEGVIHCYFAESRPWISGSHSGTSLVISEDGGNSWSPAVGNEPYRVLRKKWYSEKDDRYFYTDQMAVGIKLNGTSQLAFAVECVDSRDLSNKETNSVSIVYSPENGKWTYLEGDQEASYRRLDNAGDGGAPYLLQFHSGETVLSYSSSSDYKMYYKIGNEHAADFSGKPRLVLPYKGSWGGMEMESSHTLLACRYSSDNDVPALSRSRFALNHNIAASSGIHVADADNSDWKNTDDALYLGSISDTEATLRCAADSRNIYFLIEVSEKQLTSESYVTVMMSQKTSSDVVGEGARRIKAGPRGAILTYKYAGGWQVAEMGATVASAYDGTIDHSADCDNGYVVEISVPRTSFDAVDGSILVNFAMSSNDEDGACIGEDIISDDDRTTAGWIEIWNIK